MIFVIASMAALDQLNSASFLMVLKRSGEIVLGWPWFNPVAWALVCLFTIEMIQFFVGKVVKSLATIVPLMALCVLLVWRFPFNVPVLEQSNFVQGWWFITPAACLMVFYQLGILLRRWQVADRLPKAVAGAAAAVGLVVVFLTYDLNQGPWLPIPQLPMALIGFSQFGNLLWFWVTSLTGALSLFCLSQVLPPIRPLTALGRHTAVLMCLNSYFVLLIDPVVAKLVYQKMGWTADWQVILIMIVASVISMAITLPIAWFVDRRAPWIAGRQAPVRQKAEPEAGPVLPVSPAAAATEAAPT
jgi:hypothetical protein